MTTQAVLKPIQSFESPGTHLCGLAWDGTHLWYSDGDTHTLYRLDSQTGEILDTLPCPEVRTGLAFNGENMWQVAGHPKRIRVIDSHDGQIMREIPLEENAEFICGLYVGRDSYWTGPESDSYLEEYSLTNRNQMRKYGPVSSGDGIAIIESRLWYTSYKDSALVALDLENGTETERYQLTGNPTDMCWDGNMFWYNDFANKRICAVQPNKI